MQTSGHMSNCTEIGGTLVPTWAVGSCIAPWANMSGVIWCLLILTHHQESLLAVSCGD